VLVELSNGCASLEEWLILRWFVGVRECAVYSSQFFDGGICFGRMLVSGGAALENAKAAITVVFEVQSLSQVLRDP
jgi:hypothetical protein